jgi:hypothetical protein
VPPEFRALYDTLDADLAAFEGTLAAAADRPAHQTIFAAELLYANGNIGEALLHPDSMPRIRLLLDRYQELGIGGVGIQIPDPLLDAAYPRSSEYLDFYRQVVDEVRGRGLTILIETGPVFSGTAFSPVQWSWSEYSNPQYFESRQAQLLLIARELRPDYLSLGNEFTTEEMLTGLRFTRAEYLAFIRDTLAKIERSNGTLVGAGTGTWEDPAYLDEMITSTELDFINLHMYPIGRGGNALSYAVEAARRARLAGKRVLIGETWLYKATSEELQGGLGPDFTEVINRDVYSFWAPLDARYVQAVKSMADQGEFDLVNFFWARYFFAYLDHASVSEHATALELNRQANQAALANMHSGNWSELGSFVRELLENR